MTKSELKFRAELTRMYPGAYVKKIPDFKQTGSAIMRGLPDYLVIHKGLHIWYEVKMTKNINTCPLDVLNTYQWVEFKHILDSGVDVNIAVYNRDMVLFFFKFSEFYNRKLAGEHSVYL